MEEYFKPIAKKLGFTELQVRNVIMLLEDGATIPFIARYRKEMSGNLNEVQLMQIRNELAITEELEKRRAYILKVIREQEKLDEELEEKILSASDLTRLEDLYLPYKPKRTTKASVAREKGLEDLAKKLMVQTFENVNSLAYSFINEEKGVNSVSEALEGARHIMAEWMSEHSYTRRKLRKLFQDRAVLTAKVIPGMEEDGVKYKTYFDHSEKVRSAASHRVLAVFRGEKEKVLRVKVAPYEPLALKIMTKIYIKGNNKSSEQVGVAIQDSYKRLLQPSLENEIRASLKKQADEKSISVFAENVRQLIMASPLGPKRVLAIDPGFRTGCKIVILDENGALEHNETIYPHPPQNEIPQSASKMKSLVNAYQVEAIAIGNGTAGRETENFIKKVHFDRDVMAIMVNESGASIYSASSVAREEFPDYDVTVRGSVSIGRRLQDPLAELVKIDPKSIGVGQYQHDIDEKKLNQGLDDTVMSVVNSVGVQVNSASKQLLAYVSGIGNSLAENIVQYRNENGAFRSREELKNVARFGDKAFEQAAGFLRIRNADNPLDSSAVHPESYSIVQKMADTLGVSIEDLIAREDLRTQLKLEDFITEEKGLLTLQDIVKELAKPGRDPRSDFKVFKFSNEVHRIEDLEFGMKLPGIVTNITAFGAFVDIGLKENGLIHKSQIADQYVADPGAHLSINEKVTVKVIDVDIDRKRIQLSMRGMG